MSKIKAIEFPDRTFETKEGLFSELKANKDKLIGIKKAQILPSDSIEVSKSVEVKGITVKEGHSMHVINTTKYLDSHNDFHANGIWNKSVNDQQGKIYFVADHDLSIKSVIAFPSDVQMELKMINWSDLGADFEGKTQALVFNVAKDSIQLDAAKSIIEKGVDIQHSIRMQYVKLDLAVNSDSDDLKEEKALWNSTIDEVANKAVAFDRGYFWVVSEAKIFKEGSMVLAGSNDVTPMLLSNKTEPTVVTHKKEPSTDTRMNNLRKHLLKKHTR